MALDSSVQIVYVSGEEIRRLFNECQYFEQSQRGEITKRQISKDHEVDPTKSGQPPGTKSQIIEYLDKNLNQVAIVHQYRLPSGQLGGSGRPDPKTLRIGNILYRIDPDSVVKKP